MSAVSIKPARPGDVPLILAMVRELAEYERLADRVVATEDALEKHLFGAKPAAEAVIARDGDDPVGFALFYTTFSTFLAQAGIWLEDLFVRPEHRARGAGKALLRHLARVAVDRGYGRLEWAALDWNEPALGFYRNLGAEQIGDWITHRLDGDAIIRLANGA